MFLRSSRNSLAEPKKKHCPEEPRLCERQRNKRGEGVCVVGEDERMVG